MHTFLQWYSCHMSAVHVSFHRVSEVTLELGERAENE